ncbi:hypothetical protein ACSBR1_007821 [Camellia fascicularis]
MVELMTRIEKYARVEEDTPGTKASKQETVCRSEAELLQLFYVWSGICVVAMTLVHIGTLPAATTASSTFVGNETDHFALLAFKSKILQDPYRVVSSWNNSLHFCEWQGVICGHRHRRVTIIDLTSQGLVGSLSPYVGNLTFLRGLWPSNNTFQGEIPVELGNLFRLQILNLSNNNFEGEIPASLSCCSNLTYLGVSTNKLVGKFPKELTSLPKLTNLAIYKNNLTGGSIPDTLGQLKKLTQLGLGRNQLSGMIPPSIYNLSFLNVFSVPFNQLHGSLPPSFGFMFPDLQLLQVNANQFTGTLPLSISKFSKMEHFQVEYNFNGKISINFGRLQNLKKIGLFHNNFGSGEPDDLAFIGSLANCSNLELLGMEVNQFRGVLPESVGNLSKNLFSFALGRNQIYGTIPSTIGNLVNLDGLGMYSNQFTGEIPPSIGNLQKLQRLSFDNNKLSGKIPNAIGNLSLLTELYLAGNRIKGTIPSSLGNLSLLNELHLDNNRLQGIIPSNIGNCQSLILLNLSQNNFSGTIPKQLFSISSLSISLNLGQNSLFGSLPSEVGNLKNLTELDISENKLSGEVPSSLGSCTSLQNLSLEGNFLQGSIPSSLSSLRGIQYFNLSHNNLSGQIPKFLEQIALMYLNLSANNFEGEVPSIGIFSNASAISVSGNNRLCGRISALQLPKCTIQRSKNQKMSLAVIFIISTASMLVGVIIFLTKKLLKATDGFSSENLIGVGGFGSVYKGILDQDGSVVAVKVFNLQSRGASKSFLAECETLRNIQHRNLIKIITACSTIDFQGNDFKALVYEFMPNGSLEKWLHSSPETDNREEKPKRLNLLQRINIAIDVACTLDCLHHHCQTLIIHCDLKPRNVLLDHDMTAHVGDFGFARFHTKLSNPNHSSSIGIRGTTGYAAPEYDLGSAMSTDGDVYSYGILLLEMITGKRPIIAYLRKALIFIPFLGWPCLTM